MEENHVNLIGFDSETDVFLTEEEQGFLSSEQTENNHENSKHYRLGFENAIMEVHNHIILEAKGAQIFPMTKTLVLLLGKLQKISLRRQRITPTQ